MSLEGGFPFISLGNADKVVCMSEIDFGINLCFPRSIQKISKEWEWVLVFPRDLVKTSIIYTQLERSIFFPYKEYWRLMQRPGRSDESTVEIFLDEVAKSLEFRLGKRIDRSPRWRCAFFQIDFEIVRMV